MSPPRPRLLALALALALARCAPAVPPPPPPVAPPPSPSIVPATPAPAPPPDPFQVPAPLLVEDLSQDEPSVDTAKLVLPKLQPPPLPAQCRAYVTRAPLPPAAPCADAASLRTALAGALGEADPVTLDARLAGLEACAGAPAGFVRALRAERAIVFEEDHGGIHSRRVALWPRECADVLAEPALTQGPPPDPRLRPVLFALALAGRLERAVPPAPTMMRVLDSNAKRLLADGRYGVWVNRVARVIDAYEKAAEPLSSYARAVAQAEVALARYRMRDRLLVVVGRDSYGIDTTDFERPLRPVLDRARAPATAALRMFAALGAVKDERIDDLATMIDRANDDWGGEAYLAHFYFSRRAPLPPGETIPDDLVLRELNHERRKTQNGLRIADYVRLPPFPAPAPSSAEHQLALALPTWYAGLLLDTSLAHDPSFVAALATRGLPTAFRRELRSVAPTAVALRAQTRFRFELIRYLLRPVDIDEALALASRWRALARSGEEEEEASFYLATALPLRGGGRDGEDLFPKDPPVTWPPEITMGHVAPLNAFVSPRTTSPLTDLAIWNEAAFVERFAPRSTKAAHYARQQKRYLEAARRIVDEKLREECEIRAFNMGEEARYYEDREE